MNYYHIKSKIYNNPFKFTGTPGIYFYLYLSVKEYDSLNIGPLEPLYLKF